jgi:hypothetical protein
MQKMTSCGLSPTLKSRFINFTEDVFSDVQKADYAFSGPFAFLKQNLSNFVQVAFFDS